jgi:hypothetical protein
MVNPLVDANVAGASISPVLSMVVGSLAVVVLWALDRMDRR